MGGLNTLVRSALAGTAQWPVALLLGWLALQMLLQIHAQANGAAKPGWRLGSTGEAVILAIAYAAGAPLYGVALCLAHRLIMQIWMQRAPAA